jgi:RIO kinase 1
LALRATHPGVLEESAATARRRLVKGLTLQIMKIPKGLQPLVDDGMVDTVVRRLKSGKEASVYIVACGDQVRCAKVYKEAEQRGFHKLAQYQEGRKTRNSRDTRAMGRRGRHGRRVQEAEWKNAEVDALYRLAGAGVRVPAPYLVHEGVLLMELVQDELGDPAPRLNDIEITADQAREWHAFMITQIVRMLCAGVIHGDLSEFNVLLDVNGPVIIDLPQAVNAAGNNNAFAMLQRDVNNMRATFGRTLPELLETEYAREIWGLYEASELRPDSALTGRFTRDSTAPDVNAVLHQIEEERREAEARQRRRDEADAA